jgi:hypothetical protein
MSMFASHKTIPCQTGRRWPRKWLIDDGGARKRRAGKIHLAAVLTLADGNNKRRDFHRRKQKNDNDGDGEICLRGVSAAGFMMAVK